MVFQRQTMIAEMREMGLDPMGEMRAAGYEFRDGQLRQVNGNGGFVFTDGSNYDALADAVAQYVPLLLEEEAQLNPLWLPRGVASGEGCPIFVSEGYASAEKLLLIIQGSGRVRAGIWGCSLCINDSLEHGTMLPYLRMANALGYGVIVFNPNENTLEGRPIPGSENCNNHVAYVMENIVSQCSAKEIDVLAHSNGGRCLLTYLARAKGNNAAGAIVEKMDRVVFTDSYHMQTQLPLLPSNVRTLLSDPMRTVNFVPHSLPLGTRVKEWASQEYSFNEAEKGCLCVSTGVLDHASTNYAAMNSVFEFLQAGRQFNIGMMKVKHEVSFEKNNSVSSIVARWPSGKNNQNSTVSEVHGHSNENNSTRTKKRSTSWARFKHYVSGAMTRSHTNVVQM